MVTIGIEFDGVNYNLVKEACVRRLATSGSDTCYLRHVDEEATEPISCAFNTRDARLRLVAVGDEAGHLSLFNASVECSMADACMPTLQPHHTWKAHHNTIFSVSWIDNDRKLVTGSGDTTGIVWDVETFKPLCTLAGHRGSIKSISAKHDLPSRLKTQSFANCI
jgi:WD40 repeat protein